MNRFLASIGIAAMIAALSFSACWAAAEGDELIKMARSGVDEEVLLAYIKSSTDTFSLSADEIITLKDLGVPSKVVAEALLHGHPSDSAAMADARDQVRAVSSDTAVDTAPAPSQDEISSTAAVAPPPGDQNISFFYQSLYPYGTWLDIDGEWCWQPNATNISPDWAPYCRHGHWVYSDWGWCWQSDYSWGWAPFHYGRWFRHRDHGWCWLPDNQWGPAWVSWRHDGDYCGWAPLPPHSRIDRDGAYYKNSRVRDDGGFNLTSRDYFFLPKKNFSDQHPWVHVVPPVRADEVYRRTTFDQNAWGYEHDHFFNRGPAVDEISHAANRSIKPLMISHENIQPGQPIHRTMVRNDQMLIYKPNISPAAPQNPRTVKSILERRITEHHTSLPFNSSQQVKVERNIAQQVLDQQRTTFKTANRENENLQRAAKKEPDPLKRTQIQSEGDFQQMKAQQAQSHITRIKQWSPPSPKQPMIMPQSRIFPTPPPEKQEQVRTQMRTQVRNDAVREFQQQRNVEQMVRRSAPPAMPSRPASPQPPPQPTRSQSNPVRAPNQGDQHQQGGRGR